MTVQDAGILRIFLLIRQLTPHGAAADGQVHIQHDTRGGKTGWRQTGEQYQSSPSAAAVMGACVKERTAKTSRVPNVSALHYNRGDKHRDLCSMLRPTSPWVTVRPWGVSSGRK